MDPSSLSAVNPTIMRARLALLVMCVAATSTAGCADRLEAHSGEFAALLRGEMNLTEVAASIAATEFSPSAQLFVEHIELNATRPGEMRATERADRGYQFYVVTVRVVNNGTVDLPVSTWHFSAVDERGSEKTAITALPHHDFDGTRLRPGGERWGTLWFEMREGSVVKALVWDGTFASSRGEVPEGLVVERAA